MTDWKSQASSRLTLDQIRTGGFSTPFDAPLVPPFPFTFRDAEILTVAWRTDPDAVAAILPPPLEPTSDIVLAHLYRMTDPSWLGPYAESNVMVGCRYPPTGETGGYSPYLFLSSEGGVAHGREVHGQPKKFGEPSIETRGDAWVGRIARNGIDVLTATLPYKQHRGEVSRLTGFFDFAFNINLKAIDHIDGTPALRQLTGRRLSSVTVHECWSGPCTVELRPNVQAPLYRLPVREMLEGFWWRADFTLVPGRVLHDYLTEE
jgi:acetoacetate decarboxylase